MSRTAIRHTMFALATMSLLLAFTSLTVYAQSATPFMGMKGAGESGLGSTLGALCSAIEDAFPELDLRITQLPLTPSRVWKAIHTAPRKDGSGVGPSTPAEAAEAIA